MVVLIPNGAPSKDIILRGIKTVVDTAEYNKEPGDYS
jgi:hypothetical protein